MPENWRDWAQNNLGGSDADASQWQEYQDPSLGNYRAARIVNNQLESVVFIAAGSERCRNATGWRGCLQKQNWKKRSAWRY